MTHKVDRKELISLVNMVRPAISGQDFIPVLACVCFDSGEVYASNDVMRIATEDTVDFPYDGAVPGERLLKVLNSFSTKHVALQLEKGTITIGTGKSSVNLPFYGEDAFINDPVEGDALLTHVIDKRMIEGIKLCLISIGQDAMHPEHMGIQLSDIDGALYMHSTDNVTASQFMVSKDFFEDDSFIPAVMPEMFCRQIVALFPLMDAPILRITLDGVRVTDSASGAYLHSKYLHTGKGTDFSDVFGGYKREIRGAFYDIKGSGIKEALGRAMVVVSNSGKGTHAVLSKGVLSLETSTDAGTASDELRLPVRKNGKVDVEVKFCTELALRAVSATEQISFCNGVLIFKSGNDFTHLVAPMV